MSPEEAQALTSSAALAMLRTETRSAQQVALSGKALGNIPARTAAEILDARTRLARKLGPLFQVDLLSDRQGAEQCSQGLCALARSQLLPARIPVHEVCTGIGMDAAALSRAGHSVTGHELDPARVHFAQHNQRCLGSGAQIRHANGCANIATGCAIYVDPSRRSTGGQRCVDLAHLEPPVLDYLSQWLHGGHPVLLKLAPATDAQELERRLPGLSQLAWWSVGGEAKECLALCVPGHRTNVIRSAWRLDAEDQPLTRNPQAQLPRWQGKEPPAYLLLPDPAFLLAEALASAAPAGALLIHPQAGVLLAPEPGRWPGRARKLLACAPWSKQQARTLCAPLAEVSVAVRGLPSTSQELQGAAARPPGGNTLLLLCPGPGGPWLFLSAPCSA